MILFRFKVMVSNIVLSKVKFTFIVTTGDPIKAKKIVTVTDLLLIIVFMFYFSFSFC